LLRIDPLQTIKTAVHGAINMLGLAKRLKIKILQASTSEVYGDPAIHPQPESYWGNVNPVGPRSCYDEGKRCAETLFFDYHRQHSANLTEIACYAIRINLFNLVINFFNLTNLSLMNLNNKGMKE